MGAYPEHEKLSKISTESQAIGDFLDWLGNEKGISLMQWSEHSEPVPCTGWLLSDCVEGFDDNGRVCRKCNGSGEEIRHERGWVPQPQQIVDLLAEHFGIDQRALEAEKRAMLAELRGEA